MNAKSVKIPAMIQAIKMKGNLGTYADEPLANEEWLENYNRQERERLELIEKLRKRLDGSVKVSE